jgi:hypothetical protein
MHLAKPMGVEALITAVANLAGRRATGIDPGTATR